MVIWKSISRAKFYYQGPIYSCLAVLLPPHTPNGVEELIDVDIPLVTMDTYFTRQRSRSSYLKNIVIPTLISIVGQNPKLIQFLTKFQAKLLPIYYTSLSAMLNRIVGNNSTRSHPQIVIFNLIERFKF